MTEHVCSPRSGWRTEEAEDVLREILDALMAGEPNWTETAKRIRRHFDRPNFVGTCACGKEITYRMTECGHAPWHRLHGSDDACHR